MYVIGLASTTRGAYTPTPSRPSATSRRCRANRTPRRAASRSAMWKPMLWRFRSYSRPGLPRPTTNQTPEATGSLIGDLLRTRTLSVGSGLRLLSGCLGLRLSRCLGRGLGTLFAFLFLGLGRLDDALELLGGRGDRDDRDHELRVSREVDSSRQDDVPGGHMRAGLEALDRGLEELG